MLIVHLSAVAEFEPGVLVGTRAAADSYMVAPLDPAELAATLHALITQGHRQPGGRSAIGTAACWIT